MYVSPHGQRSIRKGKRIVLWLLSGLSLFVVSIIVSEELLTLLRHLTHWP